MPAAGTPEAPPAPPSRLRRLAAAARSRVTLAEASGAAGDLGTFLPLTLGLVAGVGLDLGTTLLFTGGYNIALGLAFDLPLPVQPMKTIAALGAAGGVTLAQTLAAGLFVGFVTLALGLTRAVDVLNAAIPPCVVRGLQLGVGLKLAALGVSKALLVKGGGGKMKFRPPGGVDGSALGATCLLLLVAASASRAGDDPADAGGASSATAPLLPRRALAALRRRRRGESAVDALPVVVAVEVADKRAGDGSLRGGEEGAGSAGPPTDADPPPPPAPRRLPAALVAVALGLILAIVRTPASARAAMRLGPSRVTVGVPSPADWAAGVTTAGGAAQLPLTTLNSVVAVSALADSLYGAGAGGAARAPALRSRWRPSRVALAVGAMNAVGCWFGAMPSCSGSGGLAAQHRFGARTGGAPVMLGAVKILVGLLFGSSLASILAHFPDVVLGGLLACSGAELAAAARREAGPRGFAFAALTAASILAADDAGIGFGIGYACWLSTVAWEVGGRGVAWVVGAWRGRRRRRLGDDEAATA